MATNPNTPRTRQGERQQLRGAIVQELASRHGSSFFTSTPVNAEIDRFIDAGSFSKENLARLIQRLESLYSVKTGADQTVVDSSHKACSSSASPRPTQTPRRSGSVNAASTLAMQGKASQCGSSWGGSETSSRPRKWNEVAQHYQRLDRYEQEQRRIKTKNMQGEVREELDQLVRERKERERIEAKRNYEHYKGIQRDVEQHQLSEAQSAAESRKRAIDTRNERMRQADEKRQQVEYDKINAKLDEQEIVADNLSELEREAREKQEKTMAQRDSFLQLVNQWDENRAKKEEEIQKRYASERQTLQEYHDYLDLHEARRQQTIKAHNDKYSFLSKVSQALPKKVEERPAEEVVIFADGDVKNEEQRRVMVQQQQKELSAQMADKNVRKDLEVQEKRRLVAQVDEDTLAYIQAENLASRTRQQKGEQYRRELEVQMSQNAAGVRKAKDMMSAHEISINRKLLSEVDSLAAKFA